MRNRVALVVAFAILALLGMPRTALGQDASLPVAARDLPRGTVLAAADVRSGDGGDAGEVVGWVTRRVINQGEPLRPPAIAPRDIIRSGDTVQLVWRDGALELRMTGRAFGSAAEGETVLVRVDTQRRFEGIAIAPGEVRLASPQSN